MIPIVIRNWWARITTPECLHLWRPALWEGDPARYCNSCHETQKLLPSEFYAQFGWMPLPEPPKGHKFAKSTAVTLTSPNYCSFDRDRWSGSCSIDPPKEAK